MADIDYARLARQHGGVEGPAAEPGMLETAGQAAKDFLGGIGSGVFSTARGAANLLGLPQSEYLNQLATPPQSTAGQAGHFVEQAAEMALPGMATRGLAAPYGALFRIPVQAGADALIAGAVSGVQTGGNREAAREAASTAGAVTGALGAAGAALPAVGRFGRRWAQSQYERAVHPTKETTKVLSDEEVVPGLIQRGVIGATVGGLYNRATREVAKWGQAVKDEWNKIPYDEPLRLQPLLDSLNQSVDDAVVIAPSGAAVNLGPAADAAVSNAEAMKKMLTDFAYPDPATGELMVRVGDLRKAKQYGDKIAAKAGAHAGKTMGEGSLAGAYEDTANAARAQINPKYPEMAKAQEQFSYWKDAEQVLYETKRRKVGQQGGLGGKFTAVAGSSAGTALANQLGGGVAGTLMGTVVGYKVGEMLHQALTSPAWRTTSAVMKDRLGQALESGNMQKAEFYLRKILAAGAAESRIRVEAEDRMPAPSGVADEEKVRRLLGGRPTIPVAR